MFTFIGSVSLPNNSPQTLTQLIQSAIAARTTYASQAQEDADKNRYGGNVGLPPGSCLRPESDIYVMTPFKAAMLAADFTSAPGGAILKANVLHYFHGGLPGNATFFHATGAAVTVHLT